MKQIVQNLRSGETNLIEVPSPMIEPGSVLIKTERTLVSLGTEKMLVQFGKASLFQKARLQPAKVQQAMAKVRTDGLFPTIQAIFRKLEEPLPLGYCNAGTVIGLGQNVFGFALGDRVASNGPHAEVVSVPQNLVAKVPPTVTAEAAAFTVIGAIGLQGIRLAKPELGETFAVIGLGLVGQITAQLLRAHGCNVIGVDFDVTKTELAKEFGVNAIAAGGDVDVVKLALGITNGGGVDGVIITASTASHDVIAQSAHMCRKRGRIVLVGVVGLNINRADFYEKELTFQVSCSYGPGRYEVAYEEKDLDYPIGFVRWTENRNFQAVLDAMARGRLNVERLITRRVSLASFNEIYNNMGAAGLASILIYGDSAETKHAVGAAPRYCAHLDKMSGGPAQSASVRLSDRVYSPDEAVLAIIGAGNFTKMTVLPALLAARAPIKAMVSAGGVTGTALARKYKVPYSSTDYSAVLQDDEVRGVIITTRHNLHAQQTIAALKATKRVLVEKPVCLTIEELNEIEATLIACATAVPNNAPWVTVGFNRRFSPHVEKMKSLLGLAPTPISIVATMNAGPIPSSHWVHDPDIGGGRILGEACHFVDLAIFLAASPIVEASAMATGDATDTASLLFRHANGSTAVVNYFANGHSAVSKERVEVYSDGRTLILDNFRELHGYGFRSFNKLKTRQDKGHERQFALFAERLRGGPALIAWSEIANGAQATFAALRALNERRVVAVP